MISVVICTYNRSQSLTETLASLAKMEILAGLSWELIVVDNNSSDETRSAVEKFIQASTIRTRYIFEGNQGLSFARNAGVRESVGDIVSFLDDDVVVEQNWLVEVSRAFADLRPACVGGRVFLKSEIPKPSWWGDWCDPALGKFDKGDTMIIRDATNPGMVGIGANLSFQRSVFDKYGLFRTDLGRKGNKLLMGEETDLVERMRKNGELTIYYPKAAVLHCPSIGRLSKNYIRRWYYHGGGWLHHVDLANEWQGKKILGIPRWRYKVAAEDFGKALYLMISGRPREAFHHEIMFFSFLGYVGAFLRSRIH